jgi:hypothetical protein
VILNPKKLLFTPCDTLTTRLSSRFPSLNKESLPYSVEVLGFSSRAIKRSSLFDYNYATLILSLILLLIKLFADILGNARVSTLHVVRVIRRSTTSIDM